MTIYQQEATLQTRRRAEWSPAQIVAIIAGLVLVVTGGVALARTGVHFNNIAATHAQVMGMNYSSLAAAVQVVVGVLILAGSAYPTSAKGTMVFFGVVLLAFGLIVAIAPTAFASLWHYTVANGVFYAVIGAVLLLVGALSPIIFSTRRTVADSASAVRTTPL